MKAETLLLLRTSLTLDDALDLLEIQEVQQSWFAAEAKNSDTESEAT